MKHLSSVHWLVTGFLALAVGPGSAQPPAAVQRPVAIVGVTVVDGTGRSPQVGATVVVREGRIVAVGPVDQVSIPADADRIEGRGRYLIAGLWDTHVHLSALGRAGLPDLVRHGITSVRDLGGDLAAVRQWRDEGERGEWLSPRIRLAGPIVENAAWLARVRGLGVPGLSRGLDERIPVETEADAIRAVDSIAGLQVEVLKIRNAPRAAVYATLVKAARARGLLVAGHQPSRAIGLAAALAAGQRSIEHIEGLDELMSLPAGQRDSLARAYAAGEVWITPTLAASFGRFVPDSVTEARVVGTSGDPDLALVTPALRDFWKAQRELKAYDAPLEAYRTMVVGGLAGVRLLRAAGVKLMAGTDLGVLTLVPGASLHEELGFLVDSLGLSPLEAIQAATVEPARYFRQADSLGTVEPGRLADLVLLGADPLADIRNVRRVELVVLRGRVVWSRGRERP